MSQGLTVFLGGAGMNGEYQKDMVQHLRQVGISNAVYGNYSAWLSEEKQKEHPLLDTLSDASAVIFYNQSSNDPIALQFVNTTNCKIKGKFSAFGVVIHQYSGKNIQETPCPNFVLRYEANTPRTSNFSLSKIGIFQNPPNNGQFNFIGYSWGSVIAARSALHYAKRQVIIDHLVLIASPINQSLLNEVKNNANIKNVIILNLNKQNDPIYAGISDDELIRCTPKLLMQMYKGNGHFYYSTNDATGKARRKTLVRQLYLKGLR